MRTVVGVFPTMTEGEMVAASLRQLGIPDGQVNIIAGNKKGQYGSYVQQEGNTNAAAAAGAGAAIGSGVGLIAGLIALAIPGVGPAIAGGAFATALTGLGVGAAAGGLIGAFAEIGIPHEHAPIYEEAVRRGAVVLTAQVNDSLEPEVMRIMDSHGARDMEREADVWSASGWAGPTLGGMVFDPEVNAAPATPTARRDQPHFRSNARSYPRSRV